MKHYGCDVLVIGSGIAGLITALEAAKKFYVILTTKDVLKESNTRYAQGGIAAALTEPDSPYLHFQDTMNAGCFHNNNQVVDILTQEGASAVNDLVSYGVQFDKHNNEFHLGKEGAHSQARVLHRKDTTGIAITDPLIKQVLRHPNITIFEHCSILELAMQGKSCVGAYAYQIGKYIGISAKYTCLATGGAGQLYSRTSNPLVAMGEGLMLAYNVGCRLIDLEFFQFHPTSFYVKSENRYFLITEALRGAGAKLVNNKGDCFMKIIHELADLAPRDIVSKAIFEQQKMGNNVFLDCRGLDCDVTTEFPVIFANVLDAGIDIRVDLLPVTPTAHYMMGGVLTNENGQTDVGGLYAIGEVSCNGLHGANRLASNSLLEGIVFAKRAVNMFKKDVDNNVKLEEKNCTVSNLKDIDRQHMKTIQTIMWDYCGVLRDLTLLPKAILTLTDLYEDLVKTNEGLFNMIEGFCSLAILVCKAAQQREESLGSHVVVSNVQTFSDHYWITQSRDCNLVKQATFY